MKKQFTQRLAATTGVVAVVAAVLSPVVASAASTTANTTINASVGSTISLTSSGTVNISLTPGASAVVSSASDTVSVSTNNTAGYNLSVADSDATTNLVSGANTLGAHTGTYASPSVLATGKWGYAVAGGNFSATYTAESNNTSSTTKWAGMPATGSPQQLKTTATTASSDATTVWYGVKVDSSTPTGTYTDAVTYTAVTN